MDFIAALASSVVESTPIVLPLSGRPAPDLQDPTEDVLMSFTADQSPSARDGHVIRRLSSNAMERTAGA